ncbi:hypothetical protein M8818_005045 [Zalaria obscura]|uniref:Uncharacterized protein n=1 Tax=Zalaria obscura TaxID=2024903 RepID=A0ACC3SD30_9PEZI
MSVLSPSVRHDGPLLGSRSTRQNRMRRLSPSGITDGGDLARYRDILSIARDFWLRSSIGCAVSASRSAVRYMCHIFFLAESIAESTDMMPSKPLPQRGPGLKQIPTTFFNTTSCWLPYSDREAM